MWSLSPCFYSWTFNNGYCGPRGFVALGCVECRVSHGWQGLRRLPALPTLRCCLRPSPCPRCPCCPASHSSPIGPGAAEGTQGSCLGSWILPLVPSLSLQLPLAREGLNLPAAIRFCRWDRCGSSLEWLPISLVTGVSLMAILKAICVGLVVFGEHVSQKQANIDCVSVICCLTYARLCAFHPRWHPYVCKPLQPSASSRTCLSVCLQKTEFCVFTLFFSRRYVVLHFCTVLSSR